MIHHRTGRMTRRRSEWKREGWILYLRKQSREYVVQLATMVGLLPDCDRVDLADALVRYHGGPLDEVQEDVGNAWRSVTM